jgi:hypothetical protein
MVLRTTIIPNTQQLVVTIPKEYIGEEFEIIAYTTKSEVIKDDVQSKKKIALTALSLDTRNFKFNRDEANER